MKVCNLQSLLERAKSGTYRAPPVRRVHIPKGSGSETRPLGIPTFEDKVLQRAVTMVLEAVYEQDFLPCSYGFRPGRSAHQALGDFWSQATKTAGGWVIELDIRKYFDSIDHERLREILRRRVLDGVLLRLIGKWLKAGVLEDGMISYPRRGSPQGGVISPILANIFLHEVLDVWFDSPGFMSRMASSSSSSSPSLFASSSSLSATGSVSSDKPSLMSVPLATVAGFIAARTLALCRALSWVRYAIMNWSVLPSRDISAANCVKRPQEALVAWRSAVRDWKVGAFEAIDTTPA